MIVRFSNQNMADANCICVAAIFVPEMRLVQMEFCSTEMLAAAKECLQKIAQLSSEEREKVIQRYRDSQ